MPDSYIAEDGNMSMLFETFASTLEAVFLAIAIVSEDMFVQTANGAALERWGSQYGIDKKVGTFAVGELLISGAPGISIPEASEFAFDPQTGADLLYFTNDEPGSIPSPGVPNAPTLADLAVAGNLTGNMEYAITFVTADGETEIGAESVVLNVTASKIRLTAIPLGGPGTISRRIYRQKNASGDYNLVATIANNTTVTYDDNIADGALGGFPPAISTAERVVIHAVAEDSGARYNVQPGSVTVVTGGPNGITAVTNPEAFSGGSEPEEVEAYRSRLLEAVRNPGTGSPGDLKTWAEEVEGVEKATVFPNDNLGVATNGHVTVRVSGPEGSIPDISVVDAVENALNERDMANVTIHVATFTAVPTNVTVTITLDPDYVLADVSAIVSRAIADYINDLDVGETLRIGGLIDAIFGLPGVADVAVTTPGSNQATGATSKRTTGVLTVT